MFVNSVLNTDSSFIFEQGCSYFTQLLLMVCRLQLRLQISAMTLESKVNVKIEDLRRSPDLLNNVKIGQGQLRLIIQTYFVLPYMCMVAIFAK